MKSPIYSFSVIWTDKVSFNARALERHLETCAAWMHKVSDAYFHVILLRYRKDNELLIFIFLYL